MTTLPIVDELEEHARKTFQELATKYPEAKAADGLIRKGVAPYVALVEAVKALCAEKEGLLADLFDLLHTRPTVIKPEPNS